MREYNIQRFVEAQESDYKVALSEIKKGRKRSHWIWYVFPQFKEFAHTIISLSSFRVFLIKTHDFTLFSYIMRHVISEAAVSGTETSVPGAESPAQAAQH
jgi:hypothetical protein